MPTGFVAPLLRAEAVRRVFFTIGVLLAYRLGCQIPLPGLDTDVISRLGYQSLSKLSLFAIGVTPIFSVLLIFEIVKLIFPSLSRWETAEPSHVRRLRGYILIAALLMAGFQARGLADAYYSLPGLIEEPGWRIPIVMTLVAATALLWWLANRITMDGLGNGFWLLLVTPSLVDFPNEIWTSFELWQRHQIKSSALGAALTFIAVAIALVATVNSLRYRQPWWRAPATNGEKPEFRVSGLDFTIVWPPLLAYSIGGVIVALLGLMQAEENAASLAPGGNAHVVVVGVLIAAFNFLQRRGAPDYIPGASSTWLIWIVLVQIFVCLGGELLTHHLALPFLIDGAWLIIVVTVATSALRATTS